MTDSEAYGAEQYRQSYGTSKQIAHAIIAHLAPSSNVPGVALYFYTLSSLRTRLSVIPYFATPARPTRPFSSPSSTSPSSSFSSSPRSTTLVRLSSTGNLIAGAIARTSVGFILNPITVVKARYEVCPLPSIRQA